MTFYVHKAIVGRVVALRQHQHHDPILVHSPMLGSGDELLSPTSSGKGVLVTRWMVPGGTGMCGRSSGETSG